MTTLYDVLKWDVGRGWLVLSGGNDPVSTIRAMALQRVGLDGHAAYIVLSQESGDDTLDDMEDLGAPSGFIVNVVTQNDDTILEDLRDASIIVVEESDTAENLKGAIQGAALQGIERACDNGSVVIMEASAASLMGGRFINSLGELADGFDWLENALIITDVSDQTKLERVQRILDALPHLIVIAIGRGSALVLGPEGAIEVWGDGDVKIVLGRDYIKA